MSVMEKMRSYVGAYGETDVRAILHADHEQFEELTEKMSGDGNKADRVRAFERLKPLLTAHARAEEQAVYNPMIAVRGSED